MKILLSDAMAAIAAQAAKNNSDFYGPPVPEPGPQPGDEVAEAKFRLADLPNALKLRWQRLFHFFKPANTLHSHNECDI